MNSSNPIVRNALMVARNANGGPYGVDDRVVSYLDAKYSLNEAINLARSAMRDERWRQKYDRMADHIARGKYNDTKELLKLYRHKKSVGTAYEEKLKAQARRILDMNWSTEAKPLAQQVVKQLVAVEDASISRQKDDLEAMRQELTRRGVSA
jgi:hypothetical protein